MKKLRNQRIFIVLVILVCAGCATQPYPSAYDPPGFFLGITQGFFIFFSFFGSIFADIRIYTFPNSGFFYDFGYCIGASLFFKVANGSSSRQFSNQTMPEYE